MPFPAIPEEFVAGLEERSEWLFATREVEASPYDLHYYVDELKDGVEEYALLAHSGHGFNSYAIQYYLVRGSLGLFLHLPWGGVYMDNAEEASKIAECFSVSNQIVSSAEKKALKVPLLVVASDFCGSHWSSHGYDEFPRLSDSKSPEVILGEAVSWLSKQSD